MRKTENCPHHLSLHVAFEKHAILFLELLVNLIYRFLFLTDYNILPFPIYHFMYTHDLKHVPSISLLYHKRYLGLSASKCLATLLIYVCLTP